MYDAILFPTDGSVGSEQAREHALSLADDQRATLHVLNVVDVVSPAVSLHDLLVDAATDRGRELVERVAEEAAERGVDVRTAVVEGDPAEAIVSYAASNDVDLIVMPTHGRPELVKTIVGSVTDKVVRTGSVPVVVVKLTA